MVSSLLGFGLVGLDSYGECGLEPLLRQKNSNGFQDPSFVHNVHPLFWCMFNPAYRTQKQPGQIIKSSPAALASQRLCCPILALFESWRPVATLYSFNLPPGAHGASTLFDINREPELSKPPSSGFVRSWLQSPPRVM